MHTHTVEGWRWMVTGQTGLKGKTAGTLAKRIAGGTVRVPRGGARLLCFLREPEDILKQLLPLNRKVAHKSEWRETESKSKERERSIEKDNRWEGDG